jgi:DNA repair protein RecN (Recombination protein N)
LLRHLSERRQVLCITHLPMIAAFATRHFQVRKDGRAGRTATSVEALDGDARVDELARLLAGARASATTRAQAIELLRAASTPSAAATPARAATRPRAAGKRRSKGAA